MSRTILLGGCAALLLGGGYWLGRSSSEPAPVANAAPVRAASIPVAAVAPTHVAVEPTLAPPRPMRTVDPALAADLRDADPDVRRAAMHEAVRDPDVDPTMLLAAAHDRDLEVAGTATIALGKAYAHGDVSATELIAIARDTSLHEKVRGAAFNGVGAVPSADALDLLSQLARSNSASERAVAGILLRNQDLDGAVPLLIGLLRDSDAHVRETAHDSLKSRSRGRDFGEDAAAWQAWWSSRR